LWLKTGAQPYIKSNHAGGRGKAGGVGAILWVKSAEEILE
jgi:succinyl-CoA synthetase beta subunit